MRATVHSQSAPERGQMPGASSPDDETAVATFLAQFNFRAANRGAIGLEREFFIVDHDGRLVPRAPELLDLLREQDHSAWDPELSACQIEVKTPPRFRRRDLQDDLRRQEAQGQQAAAKLGLSLRVLEIAPDDMPLDIYPCERYSNIAARIDTGALLAGCQLAATHIHLGVGSVQEALLVYDRLRQKLPLLMAEGDHSGGERLRRYARMTPLCQPPELRSVEEYFRVALEQGFALPPRTPKDCWWLLRISPVGTVEIRVFGAEPDHDRILHWVDLVHRWAGIAALKDE